MPIIDLSEQDARKKEAYDAISDALDAYHTSLLNREHGGIASNKLIQAVEDAIGRGGFQANAARLQTNNN